VLLAGLRPKGCRGQAARRRRAHPLGSAHAGEGAGDGAMAARSTVVALSGSLGAAVLRREERAAKRERMEQNGTRV